MEKIDYKKEFKHLYKASAKKTETVAVPKMNFLMLDGEGDPNTSQEFQDAIETLYPVSYALNFRLLATLCCSRILGGIKMLKGLRTVIYGVSDIEEGKSWYTKAIGSAPYFDQPFYVGFNVGGFELGLDPNATPVQSENTGVVAYWGVDNIEEERQRLLSIGAKEHGEIQDVGEDIKVATVIDPFGNLLGIIYNPNFKST